MSKLLVDTGIKWIGKIPEDWNVVKVNKMFYRRKEINQDDNPTILSLARTGVKIRDISNNEGQLAESYDNYHKVHIGDLMLNPMDLISGANCSVSYVEGVISPAYINLTRKTECNSRYYDYFFKNQYWVNAMFIHGKGVSFDNRWTMNAETIMDYKIPVPPVDEQNKIAAYLDRKCSKIDQVIEDNNKSIELLEEYKKRYISDTVINKDNKKMRLRNIASIVRGGSPRPIEDYLIDSNQDGTNWIKIGDTIKGNKYITSTSQKIKNSGVSKSRLLHKGDFVLSNSMSFGQPYILDIDGCIHDGWLAFQNISSDILKDYLYYFLTSDYCMNQFSDSISGAVVGNLNIDKVKNTTIFLPDIKEQQNIVKHLDDFCFKIDKVIEYRKKIIEKLEEYKKSLIYEVVTGKKEV